MMYCIYKITNLVNGKTYIGQHKYKRLNDNYMGSGKHLLQAYKKYGIENFKKDILVFNISNKEQADLLERTFIASEREKVGIKNCYNIMDGGNGGSLKGRHFSEEFKQKCSKAHKGKHLSDETKKKLSEALKGKKHGDFSEEHKKHLSEKSAWKGTKGVMFGKHHSEEAKKKISEARKRQAPPNKGRHFSEEWKRKVSESKKGRHWYNNGKTCISAKECPKGFVPGRLK